MNELVEYVGIWWLPEQPDNQVFGTFAFSPNIGITLELQGNLHSRITGDFTPSLVVGIANSGEYINILNCQLTKRISAGSSGYDRSSLIGEIAFIGKNFSKHHFNNAEEIKFQRLSICFAHLDEWLSDYRTDFQVENLDLSQETPMTIQYIPVSATDAELDGFSVSVGVKYNKSHSFRKQIKLSQKGLVSISFPEVKSLDDCFYYLYQLRNFLTLGLSVPTYPMQLMGTIETGESLEILYNQPHFPSEIHPIDSRNILFTFPDIQENFQDYLNNWFEKSELLEPVYSLYFSTLYNPHEYLQSTFLSLTQAFETYHRRVSGGVYLSTEEYMQNVYPKLLEALPKDLDNDFKQSLKNGTFRYANQFSLRKRLKDMTFELAEERLGIAFLMTKESRNDFVGKVVDARNYLTHYDHEHPVDISSSELLDLVEKLSAILEIYLLKEIGFEFSQIREMTGNHWKYKPVFRRW